jgi:hypothetical protein
MPGRGIWRLPVACGLAALMLVGVLVVALLSGEARQVPASEPPFVTGTLGEAPGILGENLLVLLMYAMGRVALNSSARITAGGLLAHRCGF